VFSNTFGSGIASMAGMNEIVSRIFNKPVNQAGTDSDIIEAANLLYANRNKFINEVNMDFTEDSGTNIIEWPSLYGILNFMKISYNEPEKQKDIRKLHNMLELKEDAGYFLWMIIIGSISVLISTNSVILSSCSSVEFNM
jgi:hypothetical protein